MSRIAALQMDSPERINPQSDTTVLLGWEATRRGYEVWHYTPDSLSLSEGRVFAHAAPVSFNPGSDDWIQLGERSRRELGKASVVLLRQDPPFDMAYLTSTWILEALPKSVKVVNHPFHVRNNPEKLFPLLFRKSCPPTLISSDAGEIALFRAEYRDIVLKPLYGHGGFGVFRITPQDENFESLIEMLLQTRGAGLVVQPFLPEVYEQERRIVMINGKVSGVYGRLPAQGQMRTNARAGGTAMAAELTPGQKKICDALSPVLKEKGIMLAGVDVIGDWLTEVNITSPTGLPKLKSLYDTTPERDFWDAVEAL